MAEEGIINVFDMGTSGVNVDKNPLELDDSELTKSQNGITETRAGRSTLVKRPGLILINTDDAEGAVLGGIGVPLLDLSDLSAHFIYVGRGPVI